MTHHATAYHAALAMQHQFKVDSARVDRRLLEGGLEVALLRTEKGKRECAFLDRNCNYSSDTFLRIMRRDKDSMSEASDMLAKEQAKFERLERKRARVTARVLELAEANANLRVIVGIFGTL